MHLTTYLKVASLLVVLTAATTYNLLVYGFRRYPDPTQTAVWSVPDGEPQRGGVAIRRYGCGACHFIPGIPNANGWVGPRLDEFKRRSYVAGVRPNTPGNLVEWIRHPRKFDPQTAMPELGVTEADARDIAAYLFSLE